MFVILICYIDDEDEGADDEDEDQDDDMDGRMKDAIDSTASPSYVFLSI